MFSAKHDVILDIDHAREYATRIPSVIGYEEIQGDHFTFLFGKDMSWVTRVLELVN